MSTSIHRLAVLCAVSVCASSVALAQTPLSGALSDSTTGPLAAGVYHVASNINIPAGQTLTVAAGVVIKFANGAFCYIYGTLDVNGTAGNKVIFTDLRDDSAGGDTNGGGASSGAAGWWWGLGFEPGSDASTLDHFEVRYSGYGGWGGLHLSSSNAAFVNGKVRDGSADGLNALGIASYPTVTSCTFENNVNAAITGVRFDALPGFNGNTATGNGRNVVQVGANTLAADTTVGPNNGINGAIYSNGGNDVPAGTTLTLNAGTIIKWNNAGYMYVDGVLDVNGSSGSKVVFTDYRDDTLGGDSNGDAGASVPAGGWWYGVQYEPTSSGSTADHLEVRYSGYGNWAGIQVSASNPAFTNCKVTNGSAAGISLLSSLAYPSVTSCTLQSNTGPAIRGVRFDALPGFSNNTATGNGFNQLLVEQSTLALDVTVGPSDGINGTVVLTQAFNIPVGQTLTLQAGLKIKFPNGGYSYIDGTLNVVGASGNNVVFTDYRDDTVGGDSNGDAGASVPAPGWWYGLIVRAGSDASVLDFFEVRYAGYGGYGGIQFTADSNLKLARGTIRNGSAAGINLATTQSKPNINRCLMQNNAGSAITGAAIDAVPFITRNTASGNGFNHLLVSDCSPAADLYIDGTAGVNDVVVLNTVLSVPVGRTLRLGPGATFKLQNGSYVDVDGTLDIDGLAADPVQFLDYRDDSVGGDSNGDGGGTLPAAGWWYGVILNPGCTTDIEHALVRNAGYGSYAGFKVNSAGASLRHCRTELSGGGGFDFTAAARAEHLAVWSTTGTGVRLQTGSFDLRHATVQGATTGIAKTSTWSGSVVDSIAWGNTANYSGLSSANVRYSDGFVGGTGNINVDPLFVNSATGDLHLQVGSPCVNAGDPFSPLDADCSRSDMGAYPGLTVAAPFTYCAGKANSAGCTPFMGYSGHASDSSSEPFLIRCYLALNNKTGIFYYGFNGPLSAPFQGGIKCVAPPTIRLPLLNSGGTPTGSDCSGIFEFDFNAHIQGGTDVQLIPGATVNVQCWYRDPAVPSATGLSNGLQFDVCN